MSGTWIERELKFADIDHAALRERLMALEAESQGSPALEENWIFDAGGRLRDDGSYLRLRIDGQGARLSFKGPPSFEGGVVTRLEHETEVDDAAAARRIVEELGYEAVHHYQKYREVWALGSIQIALDHTPIGDFIEIEGEGCETVAKRCGLKLDQAERRDYLQLYEDYLRNHPDAPREMVFPSEEPKGAS